MTDMSRSGYSYDYEHMELYRASVDRALGGRRGQSFLRELVAALDALPVQRLITNDLESERGVCAIGAVGRARQVVMDGLDAHDPDMLGLYFGIARSMAAEIMFENDEYYGPENDEQRFQRIRAWAVDKIKEKGITS